MKTKLYLSFFTLLFTVITHSQIINFTDVNLKNALLSITTTTQFAGSGIVTDSGPQNYITIDANSDGEIQQSEALMVTFLQLPGFSITNFSGIGYFINLKYLNIGSNPITVLDLVNLIQLQTLNADNSQLTSLNLTGLVSLKLLECGLNQISNLDFSGLPNLQNVRCINNLISSLDFTANPLFNELRCGYNPNLTSLKIKNGTTQQFSGSLNCLFAGNANLHYICADATEIPILQSFQATCAVNNTCVIDSACALGVEGFNESAVSVFPNPNTGVVYLDNTNSGFKTVQVYNSIGQLISIQTLVVSESASIDLNGYSKGVYLLNFQGEKGGKGCKVVKD
jgi:hypothetical protein